MPSRRGTQEEEFTTNPLHGISLGRRRQELARQTAERFRGLSRSQRAAQVQLALARDLWAQDERQIEEAYQLDLERRRRELNLTPKAAPRPKLRPTPKLLSRVVSRALDLSRSEELLEDEARSRRDRQQQRGVDSGDTSEETTRSRSPRRASQSSSARSGRRDDG